MDLESDKSSPNIASKTMALSKSPPLIKPFFISSSDLGSDPCQMGSNRILPPGHGRHAAIYHEVDAADPAGCRAKQEQYSVGDVGG